MVTVMFGAVAINSYIDDVVKMQDDYRYHFGIQGIVSIPFIEVNILTDIVLMGVIFYLLLPVASLQLSMAAAMIQFVITEGRKLGLICLSICLIDVFWDALVIH
ncbi:hypothetical protein T440DRAFT_513400 [Plenodomus tracheiphilus IPT5]|uniref:Uncharacterized protein n=1 Tax=Plenodomus tracheiphilus IPT5 TaxID=1408161 RepID=A0A6A7BPY6_9PLEO|nr:hypothetical protein T440DRAFT_513400 [Plenodomus tracheiphilus IPT5]